MLQNVNIDPPSTQRSLCPLTWRTTFPDYSLGISWQFNMASHHFERAVIKSKRWTLNFHEIFSTFFISLLNHRQEYKVTFYHPWSYVNGLTFQIDIRSTSWEIAPMWMPQNNFYWLSYWFRWYGLVPSGNSHYMSQCWPRLMSQYSVTGPHLMS